MLQILDTDEGTSDFIGNGFWIALLDPTPEGQRQRLTWDFLAPPEPQG